MKASLTEINKTNVQLIQEKKDEYLRELVFWLLACLHLLPFAPFQKKSASLVENRRCRTTMGVSGASTWRFIVRYACLIYYDPQKLFGGSPEANEALETCAGYDEVLKEGGHFVAGEALELPDGARSR